MSQSVCSGISVIIPTFNGRKKLPSILESLLPSAHLLKEIIIVVDGSADGSEELLRAYTSPILKIIVQPNKGRAGARNTGAGAATGHILFFLDDDMRVTPGVVEAHAEHHMLYPGTILVGKVSMDPSKLTHDFDFYLDHLFKKWDSGYYKKDLTDAGNLKFTTQHVSIPKDVFWLTGYFDSRLTDAEDYDFAMTALKKGIKIYYDPSVMAFHDDFPSISQYIRRQVEYKKSHKKLLDLGKNYEKSVFQPLKKPGKGRSVISGFFSSPNWIKKAETGFFRFLPVQLRYKLYAEIIYSGTLKGLGLL